MILLNKYKNKNGFTLAEILITLTIIGVIASVTIPALQNNIDDAHNKTAWKKAYATIYQAYMNLKKEQGGTLCDSNNLVDCFANQLSFQKKCLPDPSSGYHYNTLCNDDSISIAQLYYKDFINNNFTYRNLQDGQIVLNDGMHLFFRSQVYQQDHLVFVDVNGYFKGPNILGKDLFGATITKDWMKPFGAPDTGGFECEGVYNVCRDAYGHVGFPYTTLCSGAGCSAEYLH